MPIAKLHWKTPHYLLFGTVPDYSLLKVFGSLCYATVPPTLKDKLGYKARKCIFLGYPYGVKGYKCYDIQKKTRFVSRNVVFKEHIFPFRCITLEDNLAIQQNAPLVIVQNEVFPSQVISTNDIPVEENHVVNEDSVTAADPYVNDTDNISTHTILLMMSLNSLMKINHSEGQPEPGNLQ